MGCRSRWLTKHHNSRARSAGAVKSKSKSYRFLINYPGRVAVVNKSDAKTTCDSVSEETKGTAAVAVTIFKFNRLPESGA